MARLASVEIQMRDEQMLVKPTADQCLPLALRIEHSLPAGYLRGLAGRWHVGALIDRCTLRQPPLQLVIFAIRQAADRERHAGVAMIAGISGKLTRQRAAVVAADTDVQVRRQLGIGRQRLAAAKLQHACHQRRLARLRLEHRIESATTPVRLGMRIEIKPAWRLRLGPGAIVDRQLACATRRALAAAQIELARRIVAGMAGDALGGEDRLDIVLVAERLRPAGANQRERKRCKQCTTGHGPAPEK